MSTIKSDSIQPTSTSNNLILRTGVGDVERMRISSAGGITFSSAVGMNAGLTASVLDVTGTTKLNGSVYAAANVYATGGTVVMSSAYSHRNRIINGDMRVDQRAIGASFGNANSATIAFRTCDMWYLNRSAGNTFTVQSGLTATATPSGQRQYLRVTTPATTKALVNTDYGSVYQPIEGSNVDDLLYGTAAARTTTLSFWVRCSVTGTFSGELQNYPNGLRSYVYPYTINAANTWEYKTVTIPGDTGGTWQTGTNGQIFLGWNMGSGSNYGSATNLEWNAQNQFFITGSTQLVSTANATWDITGVQWELGSVATPFEYRPFSVELEMCGRYYQQGFAKKSTRSYLTSTEFCDGTIQFTPMMRAVPTMTFKNVTYGGGNPGTGSIFNLVTFPTTNLVTGHGVSCVVVESSVAVAGGGVVSQNIWTASAEL